MSIAKNLIKLNNESKLINPADVFEMLADEIEQDVNNESTIYRYHDDSKIINCNGEYTYNF